MRCQINQFLSIRNIYLLFIIFLHCNNFLFLFLNFWVRDNNFISFLTNIQRIFESLGIEIYYYKNISLKFYPKILKRSLAQNIRRLKLCFFFLCRVIHFQEGLQLLPLVHLSIYFHIFIINKIRTHSFILITMVSPLSCSLISRTRHGWATVSRSTRLLTAIFKCLSMTPHLFSARS